MTWFLLGGWQLVAMTLAKPYFDYQFPYGATPARILSSIFIAELWPWAIFMLARKKFLEYSITEAC